MRPGALRAGLPLSHPSPSQADEEAQTLLVKFSSRWEVQACCRGSTDPAAIAQAGRALASLVAGLKALRQARLQGVLQRCPLEWPRLLCALLAGPAPIEVRAGAAAAAAALASLPGGAQLWAGGRKEEPAQLTAAVCANLLGLLMEEGSPGEEGVAAAAQLLADLLLSLPPDQRQALWQRGRGARSVACCLLDRLQDTVRQQPGQEGSAVAVVGMLRLLGTLLALREAPLLAGGAQVTSRMLQLLVACMSQPASGACSRAAKAAAGTLTSMHNVLGPARFWHLLLEGHGGTEQQPLACRLISATSSAVSRLAAALLAGTADEAQVQVAACLMDMLSSTVWQTDRLRSSPAACTAAAQLAAQCQALSAACCASGQAAAKWRSQLQCAPALLQASMAQPLSCAWRSGVKHSAASAWPPWAGEVLSARWGAHPLASAQVERLAASYQEASAECWLLDSLNLKDLQSGEANSERRRAMAAAALLASPPACRRPDTAAAVQQQLQQVPEGGVSASVARTILCSCATALGALCSSEPPGSDSWQRAVAALLHLSEQAATMLRPGAAATAYHSAPPPGCNTHSLMLQAQLAGLAGLQQLADAWCQLPGCSPLPSLPQDLGPSHSAKAGLAPGGQLQGDGHQRLHAVCTMLLELPLDGPQVRAVACCVQQEASPDQTTRAGTGVQTLVEALLMEARSYAAILALLMLPGSNAPSLKSRQPSAHLARGDFFELWDVEFEVHEGGQHSVVAAHACVLAAACPRLGAAILSRRQEQQQEQPQQPLCRKRAVTVVRMGQGVDVEAFALLLDALYAPLGLPAVAPPQALLPSLRRLATALGLPALAAIATGTPPLPGQALLPPLDGGRPTWMSALIPPCTAAVTMDVGSASSQEKADGSATFLGALLHAPLQQLQERLNGWQEGLCRHVEGLRAARQALNVPELPPHADMLLAVPELACSSAIRVLLVPVHRLVLANASHYFSAAFSSRWADNTGDGALCTVEVADSGSHAATTLPVLALPHPLDAAALACLVSYAYTGRLPEDSTHSAHDPERGSDCCVRTRANLHIAATADLLLMPELAELVASVGGPVCTVAQERLSALPLACILCVLGDALGLGLPAALVEAAKEAAVKQMAQRSTNEFESMAEWISLPAGVQCWLTNECTKQRMRGT